jgi:hypothetical protein
LSGYASLKALGYSERVLGVAAEWLEVKLGPIGRSMASPLHFSARSAKVGSFIVAQGLLRAARTFELCTREMTDTVCLCDVVEPIIKILDEAIQMSKQEDSPIHNPSSAFTLLFKLSASGSAYGQTLSGGGGLYVTFQWKPHWEFDVGGFIGGSVLSEIGTAQVEAGVKLGAKIGFFVGKKTEINKASKGIALGLNFGLNMHVGLELLFMKKHRGLDGHVRCGPIDYVGEKFDFNEEIKSIAKKPVNTILQGLLLPVSAKCIRGLYFSLSVGVSHGATVVDVNLYTALSAGRHLSFVTVTDEGLRSEVAEKARQWFKKRDDVARGALAETHPLIGDENEGPLSENEDLE